MRREPGAFGLEDGRRLWGVSPREEPDGHLAVVLLESPVHCPQQRRHEERVVRPADDQHRYVDVAVAVGVLPVPGGAKIWPNSLSIIA